MWEPNVLSLRHRPHRLAVGAFVLGVLAAIALATSAQAKPLSKADRAFVDATVEAAMAEEGQPGVSIAISGPSAPYGLEGPDVFGYGLGILSFGDWIGHNGAVPGYGSEAFYEPNSGAVIAGAENLGSGTIPVFSRIFHRIAAHLYPGSME